MSTIDLIILGILQQGSKSAHDIVKFVESNGVSNMVKISSPAIYKSCKRLYNTGMLTGKSTREGEAPEKVVYSLNEEGKLYFNKLMEHYAATYSPFFLDFNAFIWNIENLEKEKALTLMKTLQTQVDMVKTGIVLHEQAMLANPRVRLPFAARAIIKQYRMIFTTLSLWIGETIEDYKKL